MSDAWQFALDRFGSLKRALDTDRREREALMPSELHRLLHALDTSRRELDEVIGDLVVEAFASPYGEPDAPKELDPNVQKKRPSPHSNHVRIKDEATAKFIEKRLAEKLREITNVIRDARAECSAQRAGVDWRKLPRFRKRAQ